MNCDGFLQENPVIVLQRVAERAGVDTGIRQGPSLRLLSWDVVAGLYPAPVFADWAHSAPPEFPSVNKES